MQGARAVSALGVRSGPCRPGRADRALGRTDPPVGGGGGRCLKHTRACTHFHVHTGTHTSDRSGHRRPRRPPCGLPRRRAGEPGSGCASARWARSLGWGEFIFVSSCCLGCSRPKSRGAPGGGDAGCCCRWSCSRSAASLGGGGGGGRGEGGGRNSGCCGCLRLCSALAPTPAPLAAALQVFCARKICCWCWRSHQPRGHPGWGVWGAPAVRSGSNRKPRGLLPHLGRGLLAIPTAGIARLPHPGAEGAAGFGGTGPLAGRPPSPPPDALVSQARSLAGRGLTAALSLLPVVIAARECGREGSELPPSGEETPGRRKSPPRSREKGGEESILHSVCVPCGEFFKKSFSFLFYFLKRNISVLLSVIISGEISQNHRNVTETRRERQPPRQYLRRPSARATLEPERAAGGRGAAAPPNFGAGGPGRGSEGLRRRRAAPSP